MSHPRARLNPYQRDLLCRRVREERWRVKAAAAAAGVSRQTAHKWIGRFTEEGAAGPSAVARSVARFLEREQQHGILQSRVQGPQPSCYGSPRSSQPQRGSTVARAVVPH